MANRRAKNPQAIRDYQKKMRDANPEATRQKLREYYAKRFFWGRAMKLRGDGRANYIDLAKQWKIQRGKCALTGRKLTRNAQLDHVIPKSKGGGDEPQNLRWVCQEANLAKRELLDKEFIALCLDVVKKVGNHGL